MQEPYWWYILFVKSNTENRVVADMMRVFTSSGVPYECEVFYFESERYFRNKKNQMSGRKYLRRPLLPGYVFVETTMPSVEFLTEFSIYFYNSQDIIKVLNSGEDQEPALPHEERIRFEYLYRGKKCLDHSVGYIVGDQVKILSGALMGREGLIRYINRHNHEAMIEVEMFGEKMQVRVALEIVSKSEGKK